MDINTLRGILTAVLMVAFIGMVFWAYSRKRKADFDEAARLPLEDDATSLSQERGNEDNRHE